MAKKLNVKNLKVFVYSYYVNSIEIFAKLLNVNYKTHDKLLCCHLNNKCCNKNTKEETQEKTMMWAAHFSHSARPDPNYLIRLFLVVYV